MEATRKQAEAYTRAVKGGLSRPDKFNAVSLFHLTALAIEGYWIGWLEDRDAVPSHHGFRDLLRAVEGLTAVPQDLKKDVLVLDQFSRLCDWIPIEPRQPRWEDIPGFLELAVRVADFTEERL